MPNNPPSIGLALSGGAARGLAHVGVLRALEESRIPISCIAGTSAGSLVAGAFASGMTIDQIEALGRSLRWRKIGRPTFSWRGFQSNELLEKFVRKSLPRTKFEELLIPFAAVATDLKTGSPVVMRDTGDIAFAIRASCTIPGVYVPVTDSEGRHLVDGGLVAVIPSIAVRSLGADIVIAVDVNSEGATFMSSSHLVGVILHSTMVFLRTASHTQLAAADYVIKPLVGHIRWDKLRRADDLIAAGYKAGLESVTEIKALIEAKQAEIETKPDESRIREESLLSKS